MSELRNEEQSYPRARRLTVGYVPMEDRLVLIAETPAHGRRIGLITRRFLRELLDKISTAMKHTHPAVSRGMAEDEVLQLEHIAALARETGAGPEEEDTEAMSDSAADGDQVERRFLVTRCRIQPQGEGLAIGLQGQLRDPIGVDGLHPEPVVALLMGRNQAHQLLRLLRDQTRSADWALDEPVNWMEKLRLFPDQDQPEE